MGVDVAEAIHLQRPHEAAVQPPAVVEIKLHGHVADAVCPDHGPEFQPPGGEAPGAAGLHREREILQNPGLGGIFADLFRDAHTDIDDVAPPELLRGPAPDDIGGEVGPHLAHPGVFLFQPPVPVLHVARGDVNIPGEGAKGLVVPLTLRNHHHVYQHRGQDNVPWAAEIRAHPVNLHDDLAAVSPGELGHAQRVNGAVLPLKGDISLGIGARGLDEGDVEGGQAVFEILLPVNLHHLHQRLVMGNGVETRPLHPGVGKNAEPDLGEISVVASGLGPHGVGHRAERQVISLKAV